MRELFIRRYVVWNSFEKKKKEWEQFVVNIFKEEIWKKGKRVQKCVNTKDKYDERYLVGIPSV